MRLYLTLAHSVFWLCNPNPRPDPHLTSTQPSRKITALLVVLPLEIPVSNPNPIHGFHCKGSHL